MFRKYIHKNYRGENDYKFTLIWERIRYAFHSNIVVKNIYEKIYN